MLIIFFNISCSQTLQNNGISNLKIKELKIVPGKTSKINLIDKYGPPVFESVFNNNTIYYVSHVSSYKNLSDRKTKKLIVFEVILDQNNLVQKVNKYDEKDAVNIKVSNKKTLDNNNKSLTFFRDIFNNIRRRNVDN
jgi:outer membrane protein assembly factor BamE (lipoprotein component of BamABCDE complex)